LQTYEIFMPYQLMEHYNSEYLTKVNSAVNQATTQNTQNYNQV